MKYPIGPVRIGLALLCFLSLYCSPKIQSQGQSLLFDFGGADSQTALPPVFWNNITEEIGSNFFDSIPLVTSESNATDITILIDQLFEGASVQTGTTAATAFPASASSDSLVRNTGQASFAIMGTEGSADTYTLTFFASDTSANDNRETLYRVAGSSTESVSLNPSGNINDTVQVRGMGLDNFGEILVTLSPGSNHSDANNIIYLGILQIESSAGWTALVDFGASDATTTVVADGESLQWNNFTGAVGMTDDGLFEGVVSTDGTASSLFLEMLSRFNGVNTNGTIDSSEYPATASGDSLYGNVEEWNCMVDVLPSFIIGGLDASKQYDITFFGSRIATDNRETEYTLTGIKQQTVLLNVAGNIDERVTASGFSPNGSGEVQVDLAPGSNNNNGNHFIYLGVLQIDSPSDGLTYLFDFGGDNTTEVDVETAKESWNNVVEAVGLNNGGAMSALMNTEFIRTRIGLEMIARFNGVNRAGSQESTLLPSSATGDSLFGNTEAFGGMENVFPEFKLTGLSHENAYDFTFYGSRSASDNRETRYTVSGSNAGSGDLNAGGNVDDTITVSNIRPDQAGAITIKITAGPNNDNSNHFTYLGAMRVDWQPSFKPQILVDVGGTDFPTTIDEEGRVWNNFQNAVGQTNDGSLGDLVAINGALTGFGIQMVSRFNGVNKAGTTESALYPSTVTQDSMFGNTEDWSGLVDIFPSFMLTGLDPSVAYDLTFYASRNATDNRETQYTVTGNAEKVTFLNVAGNIENSAVASSIRPANDGTITIQIEPGPNNDNGNHFTYLGALQIDWTGGLPEPETVSMSGVVKEAGMLQFKVQGMEGQTYRIQSSIDFSHWTEEQTITLGANSDTVQIAMDQAMRFFRVVR